MSATETRAAAWARAAEMCATTEMASTAAEMCTTNVAAAAEACTTEVATTATEVATATTEVTAAAAAEMSAAAAANMATASAASLRRRGSRTDQNDRQNNGQDIEFRHGTLEARGLRREGGDQDARAE